MPFGAIVTVIRQILDLCRREKWRLIGLSSAMLVTAFLETLGVASILPFMRLVADPTVINNPGLLNRIYSELDFDSTEQYTLFLGGSLLALIIISNGFSAFTTWLMFRVAWDQNHRLSSRLLHKYLSRPYSFFLQRNTAELGKNVLAEVGSFIQGILLPALRVLASSLVVCLLIALLAFVNIGLVLIVGGSLGTAYGLLYIVLRRRQLVLGVKRFRENGRRFQAANEALMGIKDVKVLGREASFLERFRRPSRRFTRAAASNQVVSKLPRFALETIAFGGLLLILLYSIQVSGSMSETLPLLSLFAFAGYRLMPALSELFASAVQMRFNLPALQHLHEQLCGDEVSSSPAAAMTAGGPADSLELRNSLVLNNVSFHYEGADGPALSDVNLEIRRNQTVGLVGRTGAGKTTLVDVILGLLEPTAGQMEVDGLPLVGSRLNQWKRTCGYVPQEIFLCDSSIRENIAFGIPEDQIDQAKVEEAARVAQIHEFIEGLPQAYDTVVGDRGVRLSGGQRQRIAIARALYSNPEVLVLDEATSSLDGATEAAVMEVIGKLGKAKTLIIIAHRLSTVRACDSIYLLQSGRNIANGTYDELSRENPHFRLLAGLDASMGLPEEEPEAPVVPGGV
jgi:ABC-type multidrug transport system fused ATPase/permease subunit